MVQSIQEWTSKICGRQSLKHAEADHLLKAAFHKPYLVHYWPKSKIAEILHVAKKGYGYYYYYHYYYYYYLYYYYYFYWEIEFTSKC